MKVMFFMILVISLAMPGTLWAKNLALELDGATAIEVPNSDSLNPNNCDNDRSVDEHEQARRLSCKGLGRSKGLYLSRDCPKWKRITICSHGPAQKSLMSLDWSRTNGNMSLGSGTVKRCWYIYWWRREGCWPLSAQRN